MLPGRTQCFDPLGDSVAKGNGLSVLVQGTPNHYRIGVLFGQFQEGTYRGTNIRQNVAARVGSDEQYRGVDHILGGCTPVTVLLGIRILGCDSATQGFE